MSEPSLPEGAAGEQASFILWHKNIHDEYVKNMEDKHDAFLSEFAMFVSELTTDQIRILREVLEHSDNPHLRAELVGIAIGYQVFVQGRTVQGKDANEEFAAMMRSEVPDVEVETLEELDQVDSIVASETKLMAQFGVKPNYTDEGVRRGVECINCGMAYADLAARMESLPLVDGCKGCQYKVKWG
jgi:hypothetical protein